MLTRKKKIGVFNLIFALLCFGFIFVAIFGEIACFQAYINSLAESNFQGLGVIGILIFGIIMGIALAVCGVLLLICAIVCLKATAEKAVKAQVILGLIVKIIVAVCFVLYLIVMIDAYPQGIFLKILYGIMAAGALAGTVFDCIALKKP